MDISFSIPISLLLNKISPTLLPIDFPLVLKIIYLVLDTLTAILLLLNQLASLWSSSFLKDIISFKLECSAMEEVSSANKNVARLAKCGSLKYRDIDNDLMTSQIQRWRRQRLLGPGNDYDSFGKLWRLDKIFYEQSGKKEYLVGSLSPWSLTMHTQTRDFWTLKSNVYTKMKKFAEQFLPVHMWPRYCSRVSWAKKLEVKNLVTLSL